MRILCFFMIKVNGRNIEAECVVILSTNIPLKYQNPVTIPECYTKALLLLICSVSVSVFFVNRDFFICHFHVYLGWDFEVIFSCTVF